MSEINVNEIEVNGVIYVKKGEEVLPSLDKLFIVRTYSAGVFYGEIDSRNGREVVMRNARRLWYWAGASSLSQLAVEGTTAPDKCKFPCKVERIELLEVIEILTVTERAKNSIEGVVIWHQ